MSRAGREETTSPGKEAGHPGGRLEEIKLGQVQVNWRAEPRKKDGRVHGPRRLGRLRPSTDPAPDGARGSPEDLRAVVLGTAGCLVTGESVGGQRRKVCVGCQAEISP